MHFSKILVSAFLCALCLLTFYVFLKFVLIALLFKNNQKELCHPRHDQVRLAVCFLAKSEGLVFPLPYMEAGEQFGILDTPYGGPTPSENSAPRGVGEVVQIIFLLQTRSPNHCLLA